MSDPTVTIVERPEIRAAACGHVGAYNGIGEAFARLHGRAAPAGLLRAEAEMLAVYHDDPETTAESELRSDAALSVAPDTSIPDGLTELTLPGGRYACATHVGPYTASATRGRASGASGCRAPAIVPGQVRATRCTATTPRTPRRRICGRRCTSRSLRSKRGSGLGSDLGSCAAGGAEAALLMSRCWNGDRPPFQERS